MQKKLIPLFHYSLNPGGILFQGSAETIGDGADLFAPLGGKSRLFRRRESGLRTEPGIFPPAFSLAQANGTETRLAPKPRNLSFEEAAATPWAVTPLQALRDAGGLKAGQHVLINGASGGVGTWAVQIAKALGARVTAVCSTRNVARIRALGADQVIDYTATDFVSLDTVGNRSLADCRSVLVPTGTFVSCSGGTSGTRWLVRMIGMLVTSRFTTRQLKPFIVSLNQADLLVLTELVEAGKIKPFIEGSYQLREVADALRHVGAGHSQGQTVIRMRD